MCPFVKHLYWHFCITSWSIYLKQLGPNYDSMPSFIIFWQHLVFIYLFPASKDILVWFILVRTRYKVVVCITYTNSVSVALVTAFGCESLRGSRELVRSLVHSAFFAFVFSYYEAMWAPLVSCQVLLTEGIAPWGDFWVGCEGGRAKLSKEFGRG
jgi:hypothetical protein